MKTAQINRNTRQMTSWVLAGLILLTGFLALPSQADIQSQGFSGLNHNIPTHARMSLYKYRAEFNRTIPETTDLSKAQGLSLGGVNQLGDCSLSIGNIFTDDNSQGSLFGDNETLVFIDGDVINASNCD